MVRRLLIPALVALGALPAIARAPTSEEAGRIEAALRGAGYVVWGAVDVREEDGRVVVEEARRTPDGPRAEVVIEAGTMRVAEEVSRPPG